MKVLQLNTVCASGSIGRISSNLARMLQENGDECLIAYGRGNALEDVDTWQFGSKLSVYSHVLMTRITDRHAFYSRSATKSLIQKIKEYDPDVIHIHNVHGYYVNIKMLFSFLAEYGRPVVWTLHDCWTYTGHCAYYSAAGCNRWIEGCYDCPEKKEYPQSICLDQSSKNYKDKKQIFTELSNVVLVTPSVWLKEEVEKSYLGKKEIVVIPNGINTNIFAPIQSDIKAQYHIEDKKVLLGVANIWNERKGLKDFIKLKEMLNDSYQLVLIGLSEKQIEELPDGIIGISRTTNTEELAKWYTAADIYINTSVEETMGLTTGEAICCGTPVIVYDKTAIPESVGKWCGKVVEGRNVAAVKEAIDEIERLYASYHAGCMDYRDTFREQLANEAYYSLYQRVKRT